MIIELVFLLMALTCLGLRMYVRLFMIRKTWWDDWLMVGAMVSPYISNIMQSWTMAYHVG